MKTKEIYVETTYTKNLGNYESLKLTAGITLIPEGDEDYKEVYKRGWDIVADQIQEQLKPFNKNK